MCCSNSGLQTGCFSASMIASRLALAFLGQIKFRLSSVDQHLARSVIKIEPHAIDVGPVLRPASSVPLFLPLLDLDLVQQTGCVRHRAQNRLDTPGFAMNVDQ